MTMDPELAVYAEYLNLPGPNPVPGQPGLFGSLHAPLTVPRPVRHAPLRGLGDAAAVRSMLATADSKFRALKAHAARLLGVFGPLDRSTLDRIRAAIAGKSTGGWYAEMGAAEFSGMIRFFLQGAAYSISISHALMNGPNAEANVARATLILVPTIGLLQAVDAIVRTAQATEDAVAASIRTVEGVARSIGRRLGLAGTELGFEPIEIAAGIVVAFVVVGALLLAFQQYTAMTGAADAAAAACSTPPPCTHEEWASIHRRALDAAAQLTIIPALGQAVGQAGSLLFWGGLLAVGGVLAYGAWVAAPSATIARQRLAARAGTL